MENEVVYLYLDDIIPNRFQPRENFDEQALKELAVSIKEHGVIQPIIVRKIGEKYEIIAGERRYKASTLAGLTKIPAIIKNLDDKESSKVALIENLQRKDLTPIEEARTYQKILELDALTQEDLAKTMGKSQSAVSNKLRLLTLPEEIQDALLHEQISERHARSLLNLSDANTQINLLKKIISTRMTVRELDEEIKNMSTPKETENLNVRESLDDNIPSVEPSNVQTYKTENSPSNGNPSFLPNIENPASIDANRFKNQTSDILIPQISQEKVINNGMRNEESEIRSTPASTNKFIINNSQSDQEKNMLQPSIEESSKTHLNNLGLENNLYQNFSNQNLTNNLVDINTEKNTQSSILPTENILPNTISSTSNFENNRKKNIGETIEKVKNSIKEIEKEGIKVNMEEFDFDDFYQVVVRIDKENF